MIDEIDLSSFRLKKGLSGRIWRKGGVIKPEVRAKLLEIADDFWEGLGIDWVDVEDIILTGSICNYNWSEYSDIDLHIVVDYSKVSDKPELTESFFKSKKQEWCDSHDININGFDVEVYVQDSNAENESGGVYSLNRMEWLVKPSKKAFNEIDQEDPDVNGLCDAVVEFVSELERNIHGDDSHRVEKSMECCETLIDRLVSVRRYSLEKGGEMSRGNVAYKALRREGTIDKLYDLCDIAYDKLHSLGQE